MIQKLRRKFVAICMALITALLAVVFLLFYVSVERTVEDLSHEVLVRVVQTDVHLPGSAAPEVGIEFGGDRILLPYFTVEVWGGTAYVTGGTYAGLENTAALEDILSLCLAQEAAEGTVADYDLRYLRRDNGLFQRIAFVDMSMEQAMLRNMMSSYLTIALLALALLLGVSILLSRRATRPVERAWAQQKQFLSDASHELKTPLTVILSNAELLGEADLAEKPARWNENIRQEARRMRSLVEEMLTLARADSMTPAAAEELSLSDLAVDCALAFEPVAFEAGKALEYTAAEGVFVSGDREKLHRLISILLDNAVKYGSGSVTLTLEKTDRTARLTVANPGEPIPPEQLQRLFERFYRSDASRGEQSGFGLGLSIADAIAREHHGTLRAESDPQSTRFIFTMPLKK